MLASTGDISIEPPTASPLAAIEHESCKTVEVLEELLTQSVHLRGLYKNARCQVSDIGCHRLRQLFDAHYRGQVHLVDVLIDRIRDLDGAGGVSAGDLLRGAHFCQPLRGRARSPA